MIVLLSVIAGILICWGSNLGVFAMDGERPRGDRLMFILVSVGLISAAIFIVMLHGS